MVLLNFCNAIVVFLTITCGSAEEVEFNFEKERNPLFCDPGPDVNVTTEPSTTMWRLFDLGALEEHPAPLPTQKPNYRNMVMSPYRRVYHGKRVIRDTRVLNKRFEYDATDHAQHILMKEFFTCTITQVIAESDEGVPVILQGGGNYDYVMVVFKSQAGIPLKGRLRVYCIVDEKDPKKALRYEDYSFY